MMTRTEKLSTPVKRPRQRQTPLVAEPTVSEQTTPEQAAPEAIAPLKSVRQRRRPLTPEHTAPVSTLSEPTVPEPTLPQDSFQVALSNCALAKDERSPMVERTPMFKQFPIFQLSATVWILSHLRWSLSGKKRSDSNAITRAWKWMRAKYTISTTKRLRVSETISLGEKRFVAIVAVEGREFLIGGGTAGMSLLAQLGAGAATPGGASQEFGGGVL